MRQAREKASDSLWYKDAVVYELHIKSFHDSNDDGYGIADYLDIHPDYGTLSNFKRLLREAQMKIMKESPEGIIAHLTGRNEEGIVYEAIHDEFFRLALLDIVVRRRSLRAKSGRLIGRRGGRFSAMPADGALPQLSGVLKTEQSNTSIVYDRTFFLKLYRRLEEGVNPEAELLQNLTEHTDFANLPAYAGAIEWQTGQGTPITVASLLDRAPTSSTSNPGPTCGTPTPPGPSSMPIARRWPTPTSCRPIRMTSPFCSTRSCSKKRSTNWVTS